MATPVEDKSRNKLVVLMMDGTRWDYMRRMESELKAYPRFKYEGVEADYVQPIFPSKSLPSWTTIVTGKWYEMVSFEK